MNIKTGRGKVRFEQMCLIYRPARTTRRQLVCQIRPADHDIATKLHKQASVQICLQIVAVTASDHHGRDVHLAAGCAHRDRWPTLVVDHDHRQSAGVPGPLNLVEEEADAAVHQRDVSLERAGVFQVFASSRRVSVNHSAGNLPDSLKLLRKRPLNRLVKTPDHRWGGDLDAVVLDAVVH